MVPLMYLYTLLSIANAMNFDMISFKPAPIDPYGSFSNKTRMMFSLALTSTPYIKSMRILDRVIWQMLLIIGMLLKSERRVCSR